MAYSESLARRIRSVLTGRKQITEKRMFGGVGFLLCGNMLVGIWGDSLIARLGPAAAEQALLLEHVRPMDITGRPMKGWVIVEPDGVESAEQLHDWIAQAIAFVATLPAK